MKVIWIDTETGGIDPKVHGLIQLAYLVDINGTIVKEGTLYSNCAGKSYNEKALQINNFTVEQVKTFPPPEMMYKELKNVLNQFVNPFDKVRENKFYFGGYNADFDFKFIHQLWLDNSDEYLFAYFNHGFLDPAAMVRFLQYGRHDIPAGIKLGQLAEYFQVKPAGSLHDAMTDIKLTRDITTEIIARYIRVRARARTPLEAI